jgi:hypothetical protein
MESQPNPAVPAFHPDRLEHDRGMEIELLVVRDCPHDGPARELLRKALDDVGLGDVSIRTTVIDSSLAAEQRGFIGSPTILLNGHDPFHRPGAEPALACRVYDTPDGPSGVPDLHAVRQALKREADLGSSSRPS